MTLPLPKVLRRWRGDPINVSDLTYLTDVYGIDRAQWPARWRQAAEQLLATDPGARAAYRQACKLDALLSRASPPGRQSVLRLEATLSEGPLPSQTSHWVQEWWPTELLDVNFAPAWPRLAALAAVAALGFAVGLADVVPSPTFQIVTSDSSANSGMDLTAPVIEADPLPGARPL
jgi:hypothetical protein